MGKATNNGLRQLVRPGVRVVNLSNDDAPDSNGVCIATDDHSVVYRAPDDSLLIVRWDEIAVPIDQKFDGIDYVPDAPPSPADQWQTAIAHPDVLAVLNYYGPRLGYLAPHLFLLAVLNGWPGADAEMESRQIIEALGYRPGGNHLKAAAESAGVR